MAMKRYTAKPSARLTLRQFDRIYAIDRKGPPKIINLDGRTRGDLLNWCTARWGPQGSSFDDNHWSLTDDLRLPYSAELTEFKLTWL